jgi:hypothetical protein
VAVRGYRSDRKAARSSSENSEEWGLPGARFFAGLGLAVVAALAVSSLALPLMDVATRHDSARFE